MKLRKLERDFSNVSALCSKSGKLTTGLFIQFLENILKPYVQRKHFLLLVDSWGGQTNSAMYDEIFTDVNGEKTSALKIIPPKCTSICQPCDVYFYRQVKQFIYRLQNSTFLIQGKREIVSREDSIEIHALVHYQLSSPAFYNMLKYAWYASKLIENRNVFRSVCEVCFSQDVVRKKCKCLGVGCIKCSWCGDILCFPCFYDAYHPNRCSALKAE